MIPRMFPFADLSHDVAPMVAALAFMMIPIVALLTRHQQRMALLMRQDTNPNRQSEDLAALRNEVRQLRDVVSTLAITVDNMNDKVSRESEIKERMKVND